MDFNELAAGKLAALMARRKARDLFDAHRILRMDGLNAELLRTAFVVYGAMNRKDWRTVSVADIGIDIRDFNQQLLPTLRVGASVGNNAANYAASLVDECREGMSRLLPFRESEMEFLNRLLDRGLVEPMLLTGDAGLQQRIASHPLIDWKARNVRRFKGLD